jgi:hypothetical protein
MHKLIIFALFSIISSFSFGQIKFVLDTTKRTPQIVRDVDESKTSSSESSFGQINIVFDTTKRTIEEDTIIKIKPEIMRGVDVSKTSSGESSLIYYMESLSDEQFLRLVNKLVVGEIIYKEK